MRAQDAGDPASDSAEVPALNRGGRIGSGLPALRGSGQSASPGPQFNAPASAGESTGGDPTVGLSGGGEGLSRLPRFRTGIQSLPGTSTSGNLRQSPPSLIEQRKAPPRRYTFPTRPLVRLRTQEFTTDLRLSGVIRNPVSGVPAPSPPMPQPPLLPRGIPLLALNNPGALLLSEQLTRQPDDADPAYAPLGLRYGGLTVLPAVTQSIGYDSNPNQNSPRSERGSMALRTDGEIDVVGAWSSVQLTGQLRGGYATYPDNQSADRPSGLGSTRLSIDVNRDTRIDIEGRYLVDSQRFGSPELTRSVDEDGRVVQSGGATSRNRPLIATYGTTVGVTETFNRLSISLRGSFDRSVFEDARLTDGTTLIQSDRNSNDYGVKLRAGYEISPVFTPFIETTADTRVYDTRVDQYGLRRDSDGVSLAAGVSVRLDRTLTGEVSAGWQHRSYVDSTLRSIDAPIVTAALVWAVSPLTTVRFTQQTGIIETAIQGSSGVFTDAATLEIQHDLMRNFSLTAGGAFINSRYQGVGIKETGWTALARADYRFNRWLTIRGSYIYSTLSSTAQFSSYDDHTILLGLRINP